MNNKENYKNAINQIHASEKLKENTFENIKKTKSKKYNYLKILSVAAVFVLVFVGGLYNYQIHEIEKSIAKENPNGENESNEIVETEILAMADLPRFESMEELVDLLEEKTNTTGFKGLYETVTDFALNTELATDSTAKEESTDAIASTANSSSNRDFSTTNVQVENVDEADIVKTDGEYIYYVTNNSVYIVKADNLEIVFELNVENEEERFTISEIFLKGDKVVLLGNSYIKGEPIVYSTNKEIAIDRVSYNNTQVTKAMVYDISDKEEPKKTREVVLEGYYIDSRMIGDNLYLISNKSAYYYKDMNEETILPLVKDTLDNLEKRISYSDVIYFKDTKDTSFTMVGGFNINDSEEINVETFFGAGNTVYASQNNMYLTQVKYENSETETTIYKLRLQDSKLGMQAKATVKGYMNNQFSMDEYDGNLRVATTSTIVLEPQKTEYLESGVAMTTIAKTTTENNLYILDENLKEVGKIENLAKDEKIYSVRFIGKIGYMVTFKQIDPLFVIDLSDPTNPTVKGELKIPGYSSYLHPYDENHIIGIGYNIKDNGHGGVTNSTMKMSMFDVSDLENPKEMFNISIGDKYSSSEVLYNHKALFTKFSENLIGFPVTDYRDVGFVIYEIDLENEEFKEFMSVIKDYDYRSNINRLIYIDNILYTLSGEEIISYDMNSKEKLYQVDLNRQRIYENEISDYEILEE